MIRWYDRKGGVIADSSDPKEKHMKDMAAVEAKLTDPEYKVISQDYTPRKKFFVSTVWLGLDQNFMAKPEDPKYKPTIFETMAWENGRKGRGEDILQRRYQTEQQALDAHSEIMHDLTDLEWNKSLQGHLARIYKALWKPTVRWSKLPDMIFWGVWLTSLSVWFMPKDDNHIGEKLALDVILYGTFLLYFIYEAVRMHHRNKQWKWDKIEMYVTNLVLELEMLKAGDKKGAEMMKDLRKMLEKM
jgi:hypothetical protein